MPTTRAISAMTGTIGGPTQVSASPPVNGTAYTVVSQTHTASAPVYSFSQTWNNAGVTFAAANINVTDTASASLSCLHRWQVGGSTRAAIIKGNGNGAYLSLSSGSGGHPVMSLLGGVNGFEISRNDGVGSSWLDLKIRQQLLDATMTAGGTTGNQTINKAAGSVNFAAAASSLTVTCNLCSTSSIVICTILTNDGTATLKNVVPGSGSFVITLSAAASAETKVGFIVIN